MKVLRSKPLFLPPTEKLIAISRSTMQSISDKPSGSRLIFKNGNKRPIMLHKPHPGNIVKEYAMKQVFEDLKEAGFIKEED